MSQAFICDRCGDVFRIDDHQMNFAFFNGVRDLAGEDK